MIYQALYELAEREGLLDDTSYEPGRVHFLIHLGANGEYLGCTQPLEEPELDGKGKPKGKPRPPQRSIPKRSGRTSGARAEFLVDKAEYVFGIDPLAHRKPVDLEGRRNLFRKSVGEASTAVPQSEGLRALYAFLDREPPNGLRQLLQAEKESERKDLAGAQFAFVYEPDGGVACIHDAPEVRAYFRRLLGDQDDPVTGQCLVTGQSDVLLTRLHAQPKGVPPMSKTKGGVPITSINAASFRSYGLEHIGCAPVSREANAAVEVALTRLLDHAYLKPDGSKCEKRSERVSPDTALVYWSREDSGLDFISGFERDSPELVAEMIRSPHRGRPAPIEDSSAFYALMISGMQGRAIVRSFVQSTVQDAARNIGRYFDEIRIVRPYEDSAGGYPLSRVKEALVPRGDMDALPPAFGTDLYLAILYGRPFPRVVLQTIVRRNRAELLTNVVTLAARCSLLKAYMIRNQKEEITVSLDTDRTDTPYRLGRLLAIIDKLQQDALGSVNATLVDRYFGSASSTPAAVFPTLIRRSQHHLGKLRRDKPGLAVNTERVIQDVVSSIATFPKTLILEEQGLFALGFYHQRQDLYTKKEAKENHD